MWVHGNATEHMYEDVYAKIMTGEGTAYTNPNLYTQELMSDFYGSLEQTTVFEIKYGELIPAGNWEFILTPPRQEGLLPVIKHAQFNGWLKGENHGKYYKKPNSKNINKFGRIYSFESAD